MTNSERRIAALQNLLAEEELDGMLLATSASFVYLLDMATLPFQRTSVTKNQRGIPSIEALNAPDAILYVPCDGACRLICVPWREQSLAASPVRPEAEFIDRFADALRRFVRGKRFASGDCCAAWMTNLVKEFLPDADVVPGEALVESLRRRKDEKEIAILSRAAALTDAIMDKVAERLRPGITSPEVEELLVRFGIEAGAQDLAFGPAGMFTQAGTPSAQTIGACPRDARLAPGTSVAFDFGYIFDGYASDFGRSFHCGPAPAHLREGYAALQAAQCRMIDSIVPGVTNIRDIDGMVRAEVTRLGFGEQMTNKDKGVIGHQIGIDVHEMPWMNKFVDFVLEPGMVFCSEPKMWFPGECYMRVEDMVLVTEKGAVSLTHCSRDRFELPAD